MSATDRLAMRLRVLRQAQAVTESELYLQWWLEKTATAESKPELSKEQINQEA